MLHILYFLLDCLDFFLHLQVQEVREGLETLRKKVSDLETKQKTILGVALPEDSQ